MQVPQLVPGTEAACPVAVDLPAFQKECMGTGLALALGSATLLCSALVKCHLAPPTG